LLAAFLREAVLIGDLLPLRVRTLLTTNEPPAQRMSWDGHEHDDPEKEGSAQAQRLASHTTTIACEYARQGRDWESELRQREKEMALMAELGLGAEDALPGGGALNRTGGRDAEDE